MGLLQRLQAAYTVFRGKVPQAKSIPLPYFYGTSLGMDNRPTLNDRVNIDQLRTYSETPIVRRAIDYVKNQTVRLDWDIVPIEGTKLKLKDQKKVQTCKGILKKPNPDDNFQTWLGQMIEDLLVIGMGVSEIRAWKAKPDHPYVLYPVDAASIQIYTNWDGSPNSPRYAQADIRGNYRDFTPNQLMVMKYNPRTNTPFGLSPVEASIQQIQYLLDAQSYAGKVASSATPKKMISLGPDADPEIVREFQFYFRNEIEGRSHFPIIGGVTGAQTLELGVVGDQGLFLQWQSLLINIIADAFGLDSLKFNNYIGMTRATGDTMDDSSDEGAVRPMATLVEHYINQNILTLFELDDVAEFRFRFTTSYQDRKSLAVIHQMYAQIDAVTINEIRQEIGLAPLPIDPETGQSMGDMTVSVYRAKYGDPVDQEEDEEESGDGGDAGDEGPGGPSDPNNNGGNNGVNGSPKPKKKPMNKATDDSEAFL